MSAFPMKMFPFKMYCQTVLPAVFDDSLSYYEAVCKMVHILNEVIKQSNAQTDAILELQQIAADLQKQLDDFKEHGFDDYYKEQVQKWIDDHLENILKYIIRQVYFGLTLEGYFVAYIPESWADIVFDTGYDYSLDTYGRLILRWDADSPYTVNQLAEKVR